MNSKLYWLVPGQVLYWKLSGSISATEICEMARFIITVVNKQSVKTAHLILDTTRIKELDYTNREARTVLALLVQERWMGQVVAIVSDIQIQMHLNAMSGAFGMNWKNVSSMSLAIRSLRESDHHIQNVPSLKLATLIEQPVDKVK